MELLVVMAVAGRQSEVELRKCENVGGGVVMEDVIETFVLKVASKRKGSMTIADFSDQFFDFQDELFDNIDDHFGLLQLQQQHQVKDDVRVDKMNVLTEDTFLCTVPIFHIPLFFSLSGCVREEWELLAQLRVGFYSA
ncbi:hypothetical protein L3X38_001894 [Prunus dulcis]|uniref:Uncharacterized protein n=1 Tax=Prunus dulcis TaxID=3755 RepID=A0AAD4WVJ1_PRUDU|nr:hypothetical protein L3X38_001894 [Prunus dulcis]